ncbi:MAG: hypothetical protein GF346_08420 [Candidatus Eisenbacteria bacterium]|nr:hypothetical protein [Candidatus Eisenbacteria bacterium]
MKTFREICTEAGIEYARGQRLIRLIVQYARYGYLVNIPVFGRFWVQKLKPRRMQIPTRPGDTSRKVIRTKGGSRLRFKPSKKLQKEIRTLWDGRSKEDL